MAFGFLKKLKKRISIKNILAGVKTAANVLPGGGLIKQGVDSITSAISKDKRQTAVAPLGQSEISKQADDQQWLLIGGLVLVILFFVTKRRGKS